MDHDQLRTLYSIQLRQCCQTLYAELNLDIPLWQLLILGMRWIGDSHTQTIH